MGAERRQPGIFEGAGDVGAPSHKGKAVYDSGRKEYRITGGGNNMWGARDDFYFVWKKVTGDVVITANVKIVSDGAPHRKAGLIIRKDLEAGGVYADAIVHGSGLTGLQWREKGGRHHPHGPFPHRGTDPPPS